MRVGAFISGGFLRAHAKAGTAGSALSGIIHIADWYATLCALAGVDPFDARFVLNSSFFVGNPYQVWPGFD